MTRRDLVLLLTHAGDHFVPERVAEELAARGVESARIDTDRYPTELDLAISLDPERPSRLRIAGIEGEAVRALWARRAWPSRVPEGVDGLAARTLRREAASHWVAVFDLLGDRRWVNDPIAEGRVEGHKLHQLRCAQRAGLRIPETLITNDPDRARTFCRAQGEVIAKLLTAMSQDMAGSGPRVHTQALDEEDLEHLDELRFGPMCLQRRVRARSELRVAWVEGRCFVGEIANADAEGVDWRRGQGRAWTRGELDEGTRAALDRLMRGLGLSFGAIDLIVPHEGPPVFLEVNPGGEWGMLERALGLPIAAALAEALLREGGERGGAS